MKRGSPNRHYFSFTLPLKDAYLCAAAQIAATPHQEGT
jgi:hypothetical protein